MPSQAARNELRVSVNPLQTFPFYPCLFLLLRQRSLRPAPVVPVNTDPGPWRHSSGAARRQWLNTRSRVVTQVSNKLGQAAPSCGLPAPAAPSDFLSAAHKTGPTNGSSQMDGATEGAAGGPQALCVCVCVFALMKCTRADRTW